MNQATKETIAGNTVSVVMVSYHTGEALWRSIEMVRRQPLLHELIIVNNGNPTIDIQRLEKLVIQDSRIKLLNNHGNIGFAKGCNLGAAEATGDYLLLLNPDCLVTEHSFERIIDALSLSDDYWVASGCITNTDGTEQAGSRRNLLTPLVAFVETTRLDIFVPKLKNYRMNRHQQETPTEPTPIPAISGAFIMMERVRYDMLGGLDEDYFLHVEDLDFCYKVQKQGGKIIHVPSVKLPHYRSTSDVCGNVIERHKVKSFICYFNKHYRDNMFPGLFALICCGIYARYFLRVGFSALKRISPRKVICRSPASEANMKKRRKQLLESTKAMPPIEELTFNQVPADVLRSNGPVLVIGATGQVGLTIVRRLLAAEIEVLAMYHQSIIDFDHPLLTWVYGNIEQAHIELFDLKPKTVISTANIIHLSSLIPQLADRGVNRLIAFSSTSIEGKADSRYAYEQKLVENFKEGEERVTHACNEHDIAWSIIRPTLIYGVGLDKNITNIKRFIQTFGRFPLSHPGTGLRQPVHSDDLAKAVLSILNTSASYGKKYALGGAERLTYKAMVTRIYEELGLESQIHHLRLLPHLIDFYSLLARKPETNGEIARRMNKDLVYDISEAEQDFNYYPRAFLTAGRDDLEPDFAAEKQDYSLVNEQKNVIKFPKGQ